MTNEEEFAIEVYACNGSVDEYGYNNHNKGMIHFNYENASMILRGDSGLLARSVASDLENNLRKNSKVKVIKFYFPDIRTSVPITMDGYFGRPIFYVGADFLKPLPKRRKIALSREINKISWIQDRWENKIKLIA